VTDDKSSSFYNGAVGSQRCNVWAPGGLVGYNFGPVQLNVWAVDEFSANAKGGTMFGPGVDSAYITKGWSAFAQLSYRLWAPDAPATTAPKLYGRNRTRGKCIWRCGRGCRWRSIGGSNPQPDARTVMYAVIGLTRWLLAAGPVRALTHRGGTVLLT